MYGESLAWFFLLARYVIVGLAILVVVSGVVAYFVGRHVRVESYYRGMFDACVAGGENTTVETCLVAARGAFDRGWHKQPSPGWTWPLPEFKAGEE